MFEKVNPSHPDKVADRIAGALVDMAYAKEENPRIAVEVLIGHGVCHIIAETSVALDYDKVMEAVERISGEKDITVDYCEVPQDLHLAENQRDGIRCGDNGIFKGCPVTDEQNALTANVESIYEVYPTDGKYLVDSGTGVACQSMADDLKIIQMLRKYIGKTSTIWTVNPLGDWAGGIDVDTGATNRKLGSDMGDAVTGGGLHGKDLSKADVSVNIWLHLLAQITGEVQTATCAIGDKYVNGIPYSIIVETARAYVKYIGGFEKLAEWGLIR